MRKYSTSPFYVLQSFWQHKSLIWQLAKSEVIGRYRGSVMGLFWSFFNPVLMLIIYTFVFSVVFKARWGGVDDNKTAFALILFAGMILFNFFAECINGAPALITRQVNFVKKVIFPLEILPWVSVLSALFHLLISTGVLLLFYVALNFSLHWTIVFLPLIILPLLVLTLGLTWFISGLGVYIRDLNQSIGIMTTVILFLSPVFYARASLPAAVQNYYFLNPLTFAIEQVRDLILLGELPDWVGLGIYYLVSVAVAWLGLVWFQKNRAGFADVL